MGKTGPAKGQTKEAKMKAAAGGGGKKKKKWSSGKNRDKLQNQVLFEEETYEKLMKEIPKMKLVTPSVISDRLRVNGSLARYAIKELEEKGLIKCISKHGSQQIYSRVTAE